MSWIGTESCSIVADPRFLLDSNILIYLLNGTNRPLIGRVQDCAVGSLCTSAICLAEVEVGLARASGMVRDRLAALLDIVPVLPFEAAAAAIFGSLEFRRGQFDRLIAAHALALGTTLVTANERDFADVPGLRVENWTQP